MTCRFFRLPLELRDEIYSYALPMSEPNEVDAQGTRPRILYSRWRPGSLSLLGVCKQIYHEASRVFYRSNTFDVILDGEVPMVVMEFYGMVRNTSLWEPDRQLSKYPKPLVQLPIEHLKLVRSWHLFAITHSAASAVFDSSLIHAVWFKAHGFNMLHKEYAEETCSAVKKWRELAGPDVKVFYATVSGSSGVVFRLVNELYYTQAISWPANRLKSGIRAKSELVGRFLVHLGNFTRLNGIQASRRRWEDVVALTFNQSSLFFEQEAAR